MADKSLPLIIVGLSRAASQPGGMPLLGSAKKPGLFPTHPAARQAAGRCKEEGYLRVVQQEKTGKTIHEICTITEKGWAFLLEQASPIQVLKEMSQTLRELEMQAAGLTAAAQKWQQRIDSFCQQVEKVLAHTANTTVAPKSPFSPNGSNTWPDLVLNALFTWSSAPRASDCPLPELYRQAAQSAPGLTIGQFHDGLRRLHDRQTIYLHPWTGPLYELPEPAFALLIGHEVAYYASARR